MHYALVRLVGKKVCSVFQEGSHEDPSGIRI